jgi:saccharopine dehydrogenase-like NADP-dependent oxidoreductase
VHAAGPFQRSRNYAVLEAAMATGVSYVDICDDAEYAKG